MKRMLCLFLALILAVGICFSAPVTITASAAFNLESGEENTVGAVYCDDETGLKFKITDTENKYVEVYGYNNPSANLTIPAIVTIGENEYSVTSIGNFAFWECIELISVTIPDSVTTIDYGAFCECTALESVTIGNSVETIGDNAFYYCTSLASVTIPDSVKTIGEGAFKDCTALTSVTIPDSVTTIGSYAFQGCTSLASVTIGNKVSTIGASAFSDCSGLTSVTIGKGVKEIKDDAFDCCNNLSTVNVPCSWAETPKYTQFADGVLKIPPHSNYVNGKCGACLKICSPHMTTGESNICTVCGGAVGTCGASTNDGGESSVEWLYDSATTTLTISGTGAMADYTSYDDTPWYNYQNDITEVVIENGVTTIGEFAFAKCTSLEAVTIGEGVTTIGDYAFSGCIFLTTLTIGNKVSTIGASAFEDCAGLESVTIPDSVTTIRGLAFLNCSNLTSVTIPKNVTTIDRYAFDGCAALTSINVDGANTKYSSEDGVLFNKDKTELIYYPLGKTETSYTIPESVTTIDEGAFKGCSKLTSVTIPASVTTIGDNAFYNCPNVLLFVDKNNNYVQNYATANNINYVVDGSGELEKLTFILNADGESYCVRANDKSISGELKIPATYNGKPVTAIDGYAFDHCTSLTSVTIPDGVISIGGAAFYYCVNLKEVTIPKSVTTIGDEPFWYAISIEKITVDDDNKFYSSTDGILFNEEKTELICYPSAKKGESYKIPDTVKSISQAAFSDCHNLKSIAIPDKVTTINEKTFEYCLSLESITIPSGVTSIGSNAFYNCENLESVTIPSGVTSIGQNAFHNCEKLESVIIPNGVTSIGNDAFSGCSELKTVTILSETVSVEPETFDDCPESLRFFVLDGSEAENTIATDGKCLSFTLNDDGKSYSVTDCGRLISGELEIPDKFNGKPVTSIGIHAFSSCTSLETVTIGNSVTSIGNYAFSACTALATVTIGKGVTTIGDYAFNGCTALATVTIPDSVTTIGNYTFNACTALATVTIPGSETTIGNNAFNGCTNILLFVDKDNTNVKDYATTNNINYVFDGSGELEKLTFTPIYKEADNENSEITGYSVTARDTSISGALTIPSEFNGKSVTEIGNYAFANCRSLASVTIPDSITTIGANAFRTCEKLTSVTIPDNVTTIGSYAFWDCLTLSDITIGKSVKLIDYNAFEGCIALTSITIPDSVEEIGASAFSGCTKLTSVTIGKGLTQISAMTFSACSSLESVVIPNNVTKIGSEAFVCCTKLTSVTIPDSVTFIGESAFECCSSLEAITIPKGVESVGIYTFRNCTNLKTVVLPESVQYIYVSAFGGCTSLKKMVVPHTVKEIKNDDVWQSAELTFYVELGSYAHQFAKTNNIPYIFNDYSEAESEQIKKLTFTEILNDNDEVIAYSVTDCDVSIAGVLTIPSTYNGKLVTKIGNSAFVNCESLTSVVIPDSVVSLGEMAFYSCDSLETVTLSSNITVIPNDAFAYCESLKTLPITENVASIGECAFYASGNFGSVSLSNVTIGSSAFLQCGITELTLEKCKLNDASAFINNNIEKLAILETDIPDEMFDGNSYIKTLVAENSVLGSKAFSNCMILENVTVSGGEIKSDAFWACHSLETVTIDNIGSVGEYVFYNCQALKTVEVNATKISEGAFALCDSLKNVKLGDELEVIEKNAFEECRELTEIVIPESVTTIGEEALIGCSDLKYIFFEGTEDAQKTIGDALETNAKIHYGSSTHTFNENYTVDVEPTCTEKGSESQHCKYCDLTQNSKEIKENGHTPVKGGTEGAHTICDVCKEPLSTTHNLTSKITTAPTCTEEGVETFTCECGYTYTKPVAKLGHDIVIDKAVEATCTATGLTEGSHCSRCNGATVTQKEVSALGHKTSVINAKEATCTEAGYTGDTYCSTCKTTTEKGSVIKEKAHTEVTVTGKSATCTQAGLTDGKKCSVCGATIVAQQVIPATGHNSNTKVPAVSATCEGTGLTEGAKCSVCGVTTKAQEVVPATGHKPTLVGKKDATTKEAGYTGDKVCSVCNAEIEKGKEIPKIIVSLATPTVTIKNTAKGIEVNWNAIENAESYIVYRSIYNASTKKWSKWGTIKIGVTDISFVDGTVKLGTIYKYTVRAVNGDVKSGYVGSEALKYNVVPTVKIANTATGVKVAWSTAANATGYTVYRSQYNAKTKKWSGWKNMGTAKANKTAWVDKSVVSGTYYKYTVRAVNGKILSSYKASGSLLFLSQPTVKFANASTGVKVAWSKVKGATGYTVYRSELVDGKWTKWSNRGTAKANKSSWVDKKVTSGVTYKYTVRAINGKVKSSFVETKGLLYLAQPTVTVKAVTNGINVAWSQCEGATGYTVYRSEYNTKTKKWSKWSNRGTAKAEKSNWTDKKATNGVTYKYTVRAVNADTGAKSTYVASKNVTR